MTTRSSLYPSFRDVTTLANSAQFLLGGVIQPLPSNIAKGSGPMKESFVKLMEFTQKTFYRAQTTPDKYQEFLKKRVEEVLKNSPPDPVIQTICVFANAVTVVFIIVVGCKVSARL